MASVRNVGRRYSAFLGLRQEPAAVADLKPCPHCWSVELSLDDDRATDPPFRVVHCGACGAQGPVGGNDEDAARRWNYRDERCWTAEGESVPER
jgi:hypothetical protein